MNRSDDDEVDEMLRGLPGPPADPDMAERIFRRARLAVRRAPPSVVGRRLARAWDAAEPWLVAASVVVFLGWTFQSVALLFV